MDHLPLALSSYFPVFGSPTATLEVVGNTGNPSSEKADVGFGSSYLNAFSPQDLGRWHRIEADEITHGGHPRRYDRPADQLEVLGFQTQARLSVPIQRMNR